jgi:hypothetical protein
LNYQKIYDNLIESRKIRIPDASVYYERHHIIPRSMGGDNSSENLIKLTAREHFLAHWLLWRIHRNRQMACAFAYLSGSYNDRGIITSSRGYEEARLSMKGLKCTQETKNKMSLNYNYSIERGIKISEQNIKLHSEKKIGMHGKTHSLECKLLMKEKMRGNNNAAGHKFTSEQSENLSRALTGKKKGIPLPDYQIQSIKDVNYRKWTEKYGKEEADRRRLYYDQCKIAILKKILKSDQTRIS